MPNSTVPPPPAPMSKPSVVIKIRSPNERMEMTIHNSRILMMDQKIAQTQVELMPSSLVASMSSAAARTAVPSLVLLRNR